jgi:DNA-binding MarR family transcriptional regulator
LTYGPRLNLKQFAAKSGTKKTVLRECHGLAPSEIWAVLDVTKQGAAHILAPLLKAKLVKRVGTRKTGRCVLGQLGGNLA